MLNNFLIKYGSKFLNVYFIIFVVFVIVVIGNKIQTHKLKNTISAQQTEIQAKDTIIKEQKDKIESLSVTSQKISNDLHSKNQELLNKDKELQSLVNKHWNKEVYIKNTCKENVEDMRNKIPDLIGQWKK